MVCIMFRKRDMESAQGYRQIDLDIMRPGIAPSSENVYISVIRMK